MQVVVTQSAPLAPDTAVTISAIKVSARNTTAGEEVTVPARNVSPSKAKAGGSHSDMWEAQV